MNNLILAVALQAGVLATGADAYEEAYKVSTKTGKPLVVLVGADPVMDAADGERWQMALARTDQVISVAERDPHRAWELLQDAERCPLDLRDTTWAILCGMLGLLPFAHDPWGTAQRLSGHAWLPLAFLGVVPAALCYTLWAWVLQKLPLAFPILIDGFSEVWRSWKPGMLPASFLIGRDGRVRYRLLGELGIQIIGLDVVSVFEFAFLKDIDEVFLNELLLLLVEDVNLWVDVLEPWVG